jgi:potassium/hydrogen antiporter
MSEVERFALIVLITAGCGRGRGAVQPGQRTYPGPPPAIFLLASDVIPALGRVSVTTVQRVVTVALAAILFDGGMQIGWRRFRGAGGLGRCRRHLRHRRGAGDTGPYPVRPGVAGAALLLGTALAPTDPAAVFSVLGRREVTAAAAPSWGRGRRQRRESIG